MNSQFTNPWIIRAIGFLCFCITLLSCTPTKEEITLTPADQWSAEGNYRNFQIQGQALTEKDAEAALLFHTDGESGYEVLFHNGPIDGSRKTGSLSAIRNLYRSLAQDEEWFDFEVAVRGQNIAVKINGTDVVCYTEPQQPYRTDAYAKRLIGSGNILLQGKKGTVKFRNLAITPLEADAINPNDTLPPVDEQNDAIIRLQQQNFPVIDYHVHLKGGLTKETAHALSMNYGINYGVAPNAGEGGVGRMLADDKEVYEYFEEVKPLPFLCGVQGEGRKWTATFSQEALGIFDHHGSQEPQLPHLSCRGGTLRRSDQGRIYGTDCRSNHKNLDKRTGGHIYQPDLHPRRHASRLRQVLDG